MNKRITQLLTLAITAPSGENSQPWRFVIKGRQLQVYNMPQKDTSLYNYEQRASLLAQGALLENLAISAPALGLQAKIFVFPDAADSNLVATVVFTESERFEDPLYFWIERRCTNRKKYTDIPLTDFQKKVLCQAVDGISGIRCHLMTESISIQTLANILAHNERLVFENCHLHRFLFEHIRWNDKEARRTLDGLDIRTLELSSIERMAFTIFKYWPVVEIFNKLGLSKIVAQNSKKLIASSAGIAALTLEKLSAESFVRAGRSMQRFWLHATSLGLSVQPIIGLPLLIQRVLSGKEDGLNDQHRQLVTIINEQLNSVFSFADRLVAIVFRLGISTSPSARSLRLPVTME